MYKYCHISNYLKVFELCGHIGQGFNSLSYREVVSLYEYREKFIEGFLTIFIIFDSI